MSMTAVPISMRFRADGGQKGKGRGELPGEVVDPIIGAVRAQLLGRDREIDRLKKGVGRRSGLRLGRRRPVPKGEKADLFHVDPWGGPLAPLLGQQKPRRLAAREPRGKSRQFLDENQKVRLSWIHEPPPPSSMPTVPEAPFARGELSVIS
jgi:hypothetical protein